MTSVASNFSAFSTPTYQVHLDQFEGPLALLLFLIRKEEMDIYDIPITKITKQYLDYIQKMRELDLEVAGEFISVAATLIHIKSRMLLPTYNEDGEEIEVEDPRKELVQKLLEYKRFQEVSKKLYDRPLLGRDFWPKGLREKLEPEGEGEIIITEDNALFALIGCYRKVIRAVEKNVHRVGQKGQSIAQRILELRDRLVLGRRTTLSNLVAQDEEAIALGKAVREKYENNVLITFLSLLELGKMGFIGLFQSEAYADIHVDVRKNVDRDVVTRVEEYDSQNSGEIADELTQAADELFEMNDQMTFEESAADEALEMIATDEEIEEQEKALLAEAEAEPDDNDIVEDEIIDDQRNDFEGAPT